MNCQYCGNPIPANTASCPACGARCEVQVESAPAAAPAQAGLVDLVIVGFTGTGENKVTAIRELRAFTSWGLAESKNAVEGSFTPVAFSISSTEADVLQKRWEALGLKLTTQPANPALKESEIAKKLSPQKSGCLIMFAPLAAAVICFLI